MKVYQNVSIPEGDSNLFICNRNLRALVMTSYVNGGADADTCEGGLLIGCEVVITPTPTP